MFLALLPLMVSSTHPICYLIVMYNNKQSFSFLSLSLHIDMCTIFDE